MKKASLVIAGLVFPLSLAITGCDNKEKKEEQAEKLSHEVEDAAKKVAEGVENAVEATENKAEEVSKEVENKVEELMGHQESAPEAEQPKSE